MSSASRGSATRRRMKLRRPRSLAGDDVGDPIDPGRWASASGSAACPYANVCRRTRVRGYCRRPGARISRRSAGRRRPGNGPMRRRRRGCFTTSHADDAARLRVRHEDVVETNVRIRRRQRQAGDRPDAASGTHRRSRHRARSGWCAIARGRRSATSTAGSAAASCAAFNATPGAMVLKSPAST